MCREISPETQLSLDLDHATDHAKSRPGIHEWALDMCDLVSERSRDPSTQVGAVILRPDNTLVSVGYNGFPRGCDDDPAIYADRPRKYARTVHAEMNAILTAREPLHGCRLYVSPLHPCATCAAVIIQAGIAQVHFRANPAGHPDRWAEQFREAALMFREAGVEVVAWGFG
jgi:dCMP deaminase